MSECGGQGGVSQRRHEPLEQHGPMAFSARLLFEAPAAEEGHQLRSRDDPRGWL